MVDYFTFGGRSSSTYGIYISGSETFAIPGRDRKMIQVPGRNGDLIMDNGRFENVEIRYRCFYKGNDFYSLWHAFVNGVLASTKTYAELTDTYNPSVVRYGVPILSMNPQMGPNNASSQFTIAFNCKPQQYFIDGLNETTFTASDYTINTSIRNGGAVQTAKPIIKVYGYGPLTIGTQTMQILSHSRPYMVIDSEAQDAYYGGINLNSYLQTSDFPVLEPGVNNAIKTSGGHITRVGITPRWWRI